MHSHRLNQLYANADKGHAAFCSTTSWLPPQVGLDEHNDGQLTRQSSWAYHLNQLKHRLTQSAVALGQSSSLMDICELSTALSDLFLGNSCQAHEWAPEALHTLIKRHSSQQADSSKNLELFRLISFEPIFVLDVNDVQPIWSCCEVELNEMGQPLHFLTMNKLCLQF